MRLGIFIWISGRRGRLSDVGTRAGACDCLLGNHVGAWRRVCDVGFLVDSIADSHCGSFSRTSVFRRMGVECFDDVDFELHGRCADRSKRAGCYIGYLDRRCRLNSRRSVGDSAGETAFWPPIRMAAVRISKLITIPQFAGPWRVAETRQSVAMHTRIGKSAMSPPLR